MFKDQFEKNCNAKGVSPSAACEAIGLNRSNYAQWNEDYVPRRATLQKIADYFGVTVDVLLVDDDENEQKVVFAERLLELMNERNISIRRISSDLGFGVNQIKYWKVHRIAPKAYLVEKIASYLGVTMNYLLGIEEEKENTNVDEISEGERMVLEAIRQLPEEQRMAAMMECITFLLNRGEDNTKTCQ